MSILVSDPILDEIHRVQEKHYNERKGMSWEKEQKLVEQRLNRLAEEHGYKIMRDENGYARFVKE